MGKEVKPIQMECQKIKPHTVKLDLERNNRPYVPAEVEQILNKLPIDSMPKIECQKIKAHVIEPDLDTECQERGGIYVF